MSTNPVEILYSWQAVLVALMTAGLTQLIKTLLDIYGGLKAAEETPTVRDMAKVGKEVRKRNLLLNRVILPAIPLVIGALIGAFVPLRPEVIIEYVEAHVQGLWQGIVYGAWGAACGLFADYLVTKIRDLYQGAVASRVRQAEAALKPEAAEEEEEG